MASVTALSLVNRVRRKRRQGDTASIVDHDDLACLDAINQAMDEVLSGLSWEWDVRHAQIATKARVTSVSVTTSAGSTAIPITYAGLADSDVSGDFVLRLLPAGISGYGDTALRALNATPPVAGVSFLRLGAAFPDAGTTTSGELFYAEYMLPDTVKTVHRVRYQENTLTLNTVGSTIEFDELYPRPQMEYGEPRVASIGGWDISTYLTTEDEPLPRLRLIVWPVPDDEYVLDYQYTYRHPALSAATDTLDGVPPETVDTIVELATAYMVAHFDRRVSDARALRRDALETLGNIHERHGGSATDRAVVGSWEGSYGGLERYSITGGRLIGGS